MGSNTFSHVSVMLHECIDALRIDPDGIYVDCTAGGGGHSYEIASRLKNGRLIAIDRDSAAIAAAGERLASFSDRVTLVHDNFLNLSDILEGLGIDKVNGVLMDLGVSSHQIDTADRGFSYMKDAPLDMRMNREDSLTAYRVVNEYSEEELKRIFYEYGEERYTPKIVSAIIKSREVSPIETTGQLSEIITAAYPRRHDEGHPAKRVFQAIRIEVNRELDIIAPAIRAATNALDKDGIVAVITFHSLEDRAVKNEFSALARGC
ncbi:MAG: 16S rRNA (cytosine(1402)-N(4))-methyltransferase RsmH, partial [Clostridia bacterium]|nr:16S rRNA (cytosine(1402)-N(4))-methyltransferase RsmH [Clostridia bacterium]